MVQKSHLWGVIWVPSNRPQIGHLSEKKNDDLVVQYEDFHGTYMYINGHSTTILLT